MNVWRIHFLGVPRAHCEDQQARLRSKETWAVLASLILPAVLRGETPSACSREALADRFWANSEAVDPRTNLRQCLTSLRNAFGENCLITDRQDIHLAPGWFQTDIERVLLAYQNARAADTVEERLHWLALAEQEIHAEFFEGWTPDTEEAQIWLILARADLRNRLVPVLLFLAETLQSIHNLPAAFDIARRILQLHPGHRQARKMAWDLAVATGQQDVMHALTQVQSFREAVRKFPVQGLNAITLEDGRLFQSLFQAELGTLSPSLQKTLLDLSVFPAPFLATMAEAVCGASSSSLQVLLDTPFLQRNENALLLSEIVRNCAWKQVSLVRRRQLQQRLAKFCIETLVSGNPLPDRLPVLLGSMEQGRPLLRFALEWMLEQPPTLLYVQFINMLRHYGLPDLAHIGVPYLEKVVQEDAFPTEMRLHAGLIASYIFLTSSQHLLAVRVLETVFPLAELLPASDWQATLSSTLMMACHYADNSNRALMYGSLALSAYRTLNNVPGETHILRFLGEVYTHLGDFPQALHYCEEALQRRREGAEPGPQIADALYWQGKCLFRLERYQTAYEAAAEALLLWQQAEDLTGVAFCLRLIGQLHCVAGRYAEARAHLEHARLLHKQTGIEANRIAAVEVLGDVLLAMDLPAEADSLYAECLDYYRVTSHTSAIHRLLAKQQR